MAADPLAGLAPLHWPVPPPWGGEGSLVLAAAAGLAMGLVAALLAGRIRRRAPSPRSLALGGLAASAALPPGERIAAMAAVLRAYAAAVGGADFARVEGDAWLDRLATLFGTDLFSRGDGRVFGNALYRPLPGVDLDRLGADLSALIRRSADRGGISYSVRPPDPLLHEDSAGEGAAGIAKRPAGARIPARQPR